MAPIFTAVAQDLSPDLFRLLAILAIMLTVNFELAMVATITVLCTAVSVGGLPGPLAAIRSATMAYGMR